MKPTLIILLLILTVLIIGFFILGVISKSGEAPGLIHGKLSKCPNKPNCFCSEYKGDLDHYINPIMIDQKISVDSMPILKQVIRDMGGTIQTEGDHYIASTFSSTVFGFVDDLEVRVDFPQNAIHIRSASRVGHSDLGVNKKRAELLKQLYTAKAVEAIN